MNLDHAPGSSGVTPEKKQKIIPDEFWDEIRKLIEEKNPLVPEPHHYAENLSPCT